MHGTIPQKPWTITKNGTIYQTFSKIQVLSMNLQTNILNRIFISVDDKPKYGTFEVNYFTVYYWIIIPPLHVQQAPLFHVILYI